MGVLLDFWGVHEPRERSSPEVVLLPWSLSPGSCCYVLSPRVLAVLEMSSSVKLALVDPAQAAVAITDETWKPTSASGGGLPTSISHVDSTSEPHKLLAF